MIPVADFLSNIEIPASRSQITATMGALQAAPLKRLGQNFFVSLRLLQDVLSSLKLKVKALIEIGPGLGLFSKAIMSEYFDQCQDMVLVEKDAKLHDYLYRQFQAIRTNYDHKFALVHGDILDLPPEIQSRLAAWDQLPGLTLAAGNLPYYITTPILTWFLSHPSLQLGLFLVQQDFASNLLGNSDNRLGKWLQLHGSCQIIRRIPSSFFFPKPRVDSTFILIRKDYSLLHSLLGQKAETAHGKIQCATPIQRQYFLSQAETLLNMLFWAKRKTIASSLRQNPHHPLDNRQVLAILRQSGLDGNRRPGELSVDEIVSLNWAMIDHSLSTEIFHKPANSK